MLIYKNSRYPHIQRNHRISIGIIPRYKRILTFKMLHLCPMPMTKRFYYMKLVESIQVRISVLTNNSYYRWISKKLMFCETSDQYLVANYYHVLRWWWHIIKFKTLGICSVFVSSLELKMDVLPTNSCVSHEFNLHYPLKIAPYTVSWGMFRYTEPLTA